MTWRSMLPVVAVVVVLTVAAGLWHLLDGPADLDAADLRATVIGNTLDGLWGAEDEPYKQYVADDGSTLRIAVDGSERVGGWRIEDDGLFCVAWSDGDETCNKARPQDDFFLWIDAEKSLGYPFRVLPGDQTS